MGLAVVRDLREARTVAVSCRIGVEACLARVRQLSRMPHVDETETALTCRHVSGRHCSTSQICLIISQTARSLGCLTYLRHRRSARPQYLICNETGHAGPEELAAFETDVLAGFVLARSAAELADSTIAGEVIHLDQVRTWLDRPLWEMQPTDADTYFGQVLRGAAKGTRLARAQALKTYFLFLELRHKVEIHQLTGHVVQCPVDELNRPRGGKDAALRIPPGEAQVGTLFAGWREDLAGCRKFAPAARNYTAARLMADAGLRVNEACQLDLADVKWELGRFGKLHVRMGKGARGSGPRERMVPLINNARATLEWFVRDVWCCFDDDHARPGAPLLPSERKNPDGTCARVGDEAIRAALADAAAAHLPDWRGKVTPHLLRHFCASQLYAGGMDLTAIQEVLGHSWIVTTMNYIHVHRTHVEDAWIAGQQRAARRLTGLSS